MQGMIRDLIEVSSRINVCRREHNLKGLNYIHNSAFGQHGALNAYRCLVGDRFEVKIQVVI